MFKGKYVLRLMKVTLGWVVGVIIYEFSVSQWQDNIMNWENIINFSIAGFIGILIGSGLKNASKKNKN